MFLQTAHSAIHRNTNRALVFFDKPCVQPTADVSNKASANTWLILIQNTFFFLVLTFPLVSNTILLPISVIMDSKIKC